ncbi:RraA family protein [Salipiger sp.]|uniref:RraA family protein n=1 Tax=Salipiger sp. TaxID=2078585 RepID=UPI003A97D97B
MIEEPPLLTVTKDRRRPTEAQIAAFRGVPTGFVCDAMDGSGALDAAISPIGDGRDIDCVVAGPALTADNRPSDLLATLAALHYITPGDVLVGGASGHQGCAAAGDRVMGMLKNRGGAGFVTDGPLRDYAGIVKVGLPAWCTGLTPNSPFAKGPGSVGGEVTLGGRLVRTGDMIVADRDGVVVVPFERIDAVIARLAHVSELEHALDADVEKGFCDPLEITEMIADKRLVEI